MMNNRLILTAITAMALGNAAMAQETTTQVDAQTGATTRSTVKSGGQVNDALSRLQLGVTGFVTMSRNFYSDNPNRYDLPENYRNAPSHGRFDIPEAAFSIGYDFGKGWSFSTEIEYEHGGAGTAYEKESDEGGEWESETEKGGEVAIEELFIQKSFAEWANVRAGRIVVPLGLHNSAHEPMDYFSVFGAEGETGIMPGTWSQTGLDFWGRYKDFRYEIQFLSGLNSDNFSTNSWVSDGTSSPVEFDVATKYGMALRVDNYSVKCLRIGLSAYYGHTQGNSYPTEETEVQYKGVLAIGSVDFTYDDHNWIVRGQADYGHLGDTDNLMLSYNRLNKKSPYHNTTRVGSNAYSLGIEAGYNIFSQIAKMEKAKQKLYLFGRYEAYNPCADSKTKDRYSYNSKRSITFGINYMPIKQVVLKAEYNNRLLKSQYNNEPSVNIAIGYQGWLL